MISRLSFGKYEACGNDFIVTRGNTRPTAARARSLCARHEGIGADGWVHLVPTDRGSWNVTLFNADGSRAGFSGNGFRAAALHLAESGEESSHQFRCQRHPYQAGVRRGEAWVAHPLPRCLSLSKLRPPASMPPAWRKSLEGVYVVELGNVHLVFLGDSCPDGLEGPMSRWARGLPGFPDGINVSWLNRSDGDGAGMRTWERGVGATRSCASAAMAGAFVLHALEGRKHLRVTQPGGCLDVDRTNEELRLRGPCRKVFEGHIELGRTPRSPKRSRRSDEA